MRRTLAALASAPKADPLADLFGRQRDVLQKSGRWKALLCGRRAGKTELLVRMLAWVLLTGPEGSESLFIAQTTDSARRIFWRPLQKLNRQLGLGLRFNAQTYEVTNPRRHTVLSVRGSETVRDIERPRGGAYYFVAIDECGAIRPSYLETLVIDVLTPTLMDHAESQLWLAGTPGPVPVGFWHDVSTGRAPGWDVHHWTAATNPHVNFERFTAELFEKFRWTIETVKYVREYLARWVLDTSRAAFRFDPARNILQKLPALHRLDRWAYVFAADFGVDNATAYVVLAYPERFPADAIVIESGMRKGKAPSEIAAWLHAGPLARYDFASMVGDVGGLGKGFAQELAVRYGVELRAAKKENRRGAIEVTSDLLYTGRLKSLACNDELHVQLAQILLDDDRKDFAAGQEDDLADALIYAARETPCFDQPIVLPPDRPDGTPDHVLDPDERDEPPEPHYLDVPDLYDWRHAA